ncbi:hypothetical protein ACS0TY_005518 [Phlomoides rotata]
MGRPQYQGNYQQNFQGRLRKKEIKMVTTRFDIEKFSRKVDFDLWRIKMKALLVHQGLADALKDDLGESSITDGEESSSAAAERAKMMENAHIAIILCLGDKTLREVSKRNQLLMEYGINLRVYTW